MDDITKLTVHELIEKKQNGELNSEQIVKAYADKINEKEKDINAFITITTDEALKQIDQELAKCKQEDNNAEKCKEYNEGSNDKNKSGSKDRTLGKFAGIPIGIKDNLCTKGTMCIKNAWKFCITLWCNCCKKNKWWGNY